MNDEAIGEVTVAMRNLLQQGLGDDYQVSLWTPWEDFGMEKGVNLFLYRVNESPPWKNMDWPGDSAHPDKILRTPLSLDLFYLLTPYSPRVATPITDTALSGRILGKAMQILHENPVLNDIHNPYYDADDNEHFAEDLRNSYEQIKIMLNPVDLEEMSKIWSMGDKPYRLSATYCVSLVQIAPTAPAKSIAAPVQETGVSVTSFTPPVVTELQPTGGPAGGELRITGHKLWLKGFSTVVRIGDASITGFTSIAEDRIVLTVPDSLVKGPELPVMVAVGGRESDPVPFRVSPWIQKVKPRRGAVDSADAHAVPVEINGSGLQGAVTITVGGVAVADADIDVVGDSVIRTYIPAALANGFHDIGLTVDGSPANKRRFEVIPLLRNISPSQGKTGDALTLNGRRLNGTQIRITVGPSVVIAPANAVPDSISMAVPKSLSPGDYEVNITVDGHESSAVTFKVVK